MLKVPFLVEEGETVHYKKLVARILTGTSDANIRFEELCALLNTLGFEMRVRGSHHIFRRERVAEKINLQREGNMAKPYQVKQVRNIIVKYRMGGTDDV